MSLNPLTIAHLGIGRRPLVAALLGIWDELMEVLASASGGGKAIPKPRPRRPWVVPAQFIKVPSRRRDEEALLLLGAL